MDYVRTVKGSMPTLYRQLKKLPWAVIPAVSSVSTGHVRRSRRTIKVALAPAWMTTISAAQDRGGFKSDPDCGTVTAFMAQTRD